MILRFPNPDTFRLAATSSLLPRAVAISELDFFEVPNAECFARFEGKLDKNALNELGLLGVKAAKEIPGEVQKYSCWLQAIPAVRDPHPPTLAANAPVLFELPDADELSGIVSEMLRLGNDRQGFRWISNPADSSQRRVLLRVVGPPYYTLLRALDRLAVGEGGPVRAFAEAAPRVWVELGYSHPAAAKIQLPEDQLLLMRAPRDWTYLPEVPFQDIYEILQFQLPQPVRNWQAREFPDSIPVPLKLASGHSNESPELWILRGEAGLNELNRFVQNCDERTAQRLKFAIADRPDGERVAVVRASALRGGGPILELTGALAYKPHPSLSNLFLPVGMRLHPTLRRDALRELMAEDPDQIVWLVPGSDGAFAPESVLDSAFVLLDEWVDYIVEQAHEPLKAWVESTRFDFAGFICSDEKGPKPRDPGAGPQKSGEGEPKAVEPPREAITSLPVRDDAVPVRGSSSAVVLSAELAPNEWKARRDALQKQFLSIPGPLDAPDRAALWVQLAEANAGAGDLGEAALCWTHALWLQDSPDPELLTIWSRAERGNSNKIAATEFDFHLDNTEPVKGEARRFAALVCELGYSPNRPAWFASRLPRVQKHLEIQEPKLPVRVVWLVARCLAKLSGADTLGLARIRDRLLQRLLEGGLNPELDLPFFLRTAGLNDSERVRQVRDRAEEIYQAVRKWVEIGTKAPNVGKVKTDPNPSVGYVDLLFAFGLAKLGESQAAAKLRAAGRAILEQAPEESNRGIAGRFLAQAFDYRIQQALAGQPLAGRLPEELYEQLAQIQKRAKGAVNNPYGLAHFAIERMQQQSKIVEPIERVDPVRYFTAAHEGGLRKSFLDLAGESDPLRLANRLRDLYRKENPARPGEGPTEKQFLILLDGLPLAARCGSTTAAEFIRLVPAALRQAYPNNPELPKKQGQLLERALFLAGHFDHRDLVGDLIEVFLQTAKSKPDEQRYELINEIGSAGLRSLRKLGLRDEIDGLLQRLQSLILGAATLNDCKARWSGKPEIWRAALQSLLNLAGGWLLFGRNELAAPILEAARNELLAPGGGKTMPQSYARLAVAYIAAIGQGPAELGIPRLLELFQKIEAGKITLGFTTAEFYSRLHLNVVEEVVLAVVSDDFVLGASGRRWLEDDEYSVRQRIHADLRRSLAGHGL